MKGSDFDVGGWLVLLGPLIAVSGREAQARHAGLRAVLIGHSFPSSSGLVLAHT